MLMLRRYCSQFQRISAINASKQTGVQASVQGWIQNVRRLKNNIFLDVNDGTTSRRFQIVVPKSERIKDISAGCSVSASGIVQVAPNGHYELHADDIEVIAEGHIKDGFPFTPKQKHPPEYVRDHLHLRSRIDYVAAQMRLRHKAQKAIHDFMDQQGFVHIHTPILTTNDCEGAGEVFSVQPDSKELLKEMSRPEVPLEQSYFDSKVFLSVSGQLHLEAMAYGLGNVYNFAPAFRAENSKSPLHLAEFYMFEAELAFVEELPQLTGFIETMLKAVTSQLLNTPSTMEDLQHCQQKALGEVMDLAWLQQKWHTLAYDEALEIVLARRDQFKTEVNPGEGLTKEQELFLVEHCGSPVFVVDWPAAQKPFYMRQSPHRPGFVQALDLLMPRVGELCGGSLRETQVERLQRHPSFPPELGWYLELRKYGGIPTGGFGMGFERYLQLISGVKNIRDVIPFPRFPHSCRM